jgi:hypothetical protein
LLAVLVQHLSADQYFHFVLKLHCLACKAPQPCSSKVADDRAQSKSVLLLQMTMSSSLAYGVVLSAMCVAWRTSFSVMPCQGQDLERRIARVGGHRSDDEARALNARIAKLTEVLEGVNTEHSMLLEQVGEHCCCS